MGWTVRSSNRGGGEVFRAVQMSPEAHPSLLYNGGRSVVLTTHVLLQTSCKAVGCIPPLPPSASPGMSWGCLYLLLLFVCYWSDSPQWAMASSLSRFLDHTQRRITVGRTPLDEWSACRRHLYLTTHNTHYTQTLMPPAGFEPTISADERPQTNALHRAATGTCTSYLYLSHTLPSPSKSFHTLLPRTVAIQIPSGPPCSPVKHCCLLLASSHPSRWDRSSSSRRVNTWWEDTVFISCRSITSQ